ncbi:ATP-dependent DNA helicase RecG [Xanthomonadaceae bacterium JHOS43]|nr:ATP-dependent DNA helicase RecG [Xanthomonadaceae bacterium JHOS43]
MTQDAARQSPAMLRGVGPQLGARLAARGVTTLQDLWLHLPLRYEDRTRLTPIRLLRAGESAQVHGRIEAVERAFRGRPVLKVAVGDASDGTLVLRFFHFHAAQAKALRIGASIVCHGEVRAGQLGLEMVHPGYRVLDEDAPPHLSDRLDPVYPAIEGVGPVQLARIIGAALDYLPQDDVLELLPDGLWGDLSLPRWHEAVRFLHRPPPGVDLSDLARHRHPAQLRLALEELLSHQLSLRRQRLAVKQLGAQAFYPSERFARRLAATLPFALTAAQQRVLGDISRDLAHPEPMLRLVQGDVGSGKTIVAAFAALAAIESGAQVALMAPTELLAEQHAQSFRQWFEPLGIELVWLAGKVKGKAREAALARIAGGASLVVGTHALLQEPVRFANLALVIVDEQHRFGVRQRLVLRDKGASGTQVPHQLVMTATPIPRTLAMTAYADLDVSVIDELPPGRTPVQTVAINEHRRDEVIQRIRAACNEGRQAYWVCTLIEESDDPTAPGVPKIEARAAETAYDLLRQQLPDVRVGLIHGRMKPAEKQATMMAFKSGDIQLLVATTVIEVGVDVPNASLMLIENAERLGLAQLHQLRGRVGRGAAASSCVLMYKAPLSPLARERLAVMRETTDGFRIAEKDLELRGPGEFLGTRQTGLAGFRIADPVRDAALLPHVQVAADALLATAPHIADRLIDRWIGHAVRYADA